MDPGLASGRVCVRAQCGWRDLCVDVAEINPGLLRKRRGAWHSAKQMGEASD